MPSSEAKAECLIDDFELFDDWQERYGYIIDLGRKLPVPDEAEKTEENRVHGCQSRVWVVAESHIEGDEPIIEFKADSDSAIVKGLLAIVYTIYSGQTARDILAFDFAGLMERLQLEQNLSSNRGNGLRAVVDRVKRLAAETLAA